MQTAPSFQPIDLKSLVFDDKFVRTLPADPSRVNQTRQVPQSAFSFVEPTPVSRPELLAWSDTLATELGLARPAPGDQQSLGILAGNQLLPSMRPYAACYGGHQFGNWAGQLGDGRAITLGEFIDPQQRRWDIQLKGAGRTPYSRHADGRAVLRSSVREFLCSEAMHHLGIPSTRALSLAATGDQVLRDMFYDGHPAYEPGAIVTRVAPSFIRFGNFEIHASRGEIAQLRLLADYVLETHFPELDRTDPQVYKLWYLEIAERTATMIAHWMRVGFVHGVMNTDNMSILGLTIDYGPYGWLDVYEPGWTPNTTDAGQRRYAYYNQPPIGFWNLAQLGRALSFLGLETEDIRAGLDHYRVHFEKTYQEMMRAKLGWQRSDVPGDTELIEELEQVLQVAETDMTIFFRKLALMETGEDTSAKSDRQLLEPLREAYYEDIFQSEHLGDIAAWLRRYSERTRLDRLDADARRSLMNRNNPKYILRNYLSQEAIDAAAEGDLSKLERLLKVIQKPYDEQAEHEDLAGRRPDWARNKAGCSALSCSS